MPLLECRSQLTQPAVDALITQSSYAIGKIYLDFKMLDTLQGGNCEDALSPTETNNIATKSVAV